MRTKMKGRCARTVSTAVSFLALIFTAESAMAFDPPAPSVSACFGFGASPYFADVVSGVSGNELVIMNVDETFKPDADFDGRREVLAEALVKVIDRNGIVLWRSPKLSIRSPDTATLVQNNSYFLSGFGSQTFAAPLFLGGSPCYGSAFAIEAGGQQYMAVMAGFLTQTGFDDETGSDASTLNIWILNRDTGAIEIRHVFRPRNNKFLAGLTLTGIGPVDGDADDEIVATWATPTGGGKYTLLVETYNILTGVREDRFQEFIRNTRTVQ